MVDRIHGTGNPEGDTAESKHLGHQISGSDLLNSSLTSLLTTDKIRVCGERLLSPLSTKLHLHPVMPPGSGRQPVHACGETDPSTPR